MLQKIQAYNKWLLIQYIIQEHLWITESAYKAVIQYCLHTKLQKAIVNTEVHVIWKENNLLKREPERLTEKVSKDNFVVSGVVKINLFINSTDLHLKYL